MVDTEAELTKTRLVRQHHWLPHDWRTVNGKPSYRCNVNRTTVYKCRVCTRTKALIHIAGTYGGGLFGKWEDVPDNLCHERPEPAAFSEVQQDYWFKMGLFALFVLLWGFGVLAVLALTLGRSG